jgi:hypothetical protein
MGSMGEITAQTSDGKEQAHELGKKQQQLHLLNRGVGMQDQAAYMQK